MRAKGWVRGRIVRGGIVRGGWVQGRCRSSRGRRRGVMAITCGPWRSARVVEAKIAADVCETLGVFDPSGFGD
jgi:hypothetical protein